jgi:putative endonuclease
MYYVYVLKNVNDGSWYIGYSANLKQRVERHNNGDGARTTARKKDWRLIYYEAYLNELDAKGRERFLKSGSGRTFLKKQLTNFLGQNN